MSRSTSAGGRWTSTLSSSSASTSASTITFSSESSQTIRYTTTPPVPHLEPWGPGGATIYGGKGQGIYLNAQGQWQPFREGQTVGYRLGATHYSWGL